MRIALLGDIGFFGKYTIEKNKNIYQYFKRVSEQLKQYDYVIGNLEVPFVSNLKPKLIKSACIGSQDTNVTLLKYLNIDVVNLANNHVLDYGFKGYINTINLLKENNIDFFGVEQKQVILKKDDTKIALHGYCAYNSSPYGIYSKKRGYGINELNISDIKKKLSENTEKGYFNIISMHSGQEHINFPSVEDMNMARYFSENQPYIYYGHHPHVIQGLEKVNGSLIAYSLGNFCFDDIYTKKSKKPLIVQTNNNKSSFILEVEIKNNKIINHKTIPIFSGENEMELGDSSIIDKLKQYSDKLQEDSKQYSENRKKLISQFLKNRKKLRDLNWYIKRLNYKSAIMIYNARMNQKNQYKSVTKHLEDLKSL